MGNKRLAALVVAALICLMLVGAAGHAVHHLGHGHACAECPACTEISHWGSLLRRVAPAWLLMMGAMVALRGVAVMGDAGRLMLPAPTPVALKVKMTD